MGVIYFWRSTRTRVPSFLNIRTAINSLILQFVYKQTQCCTMDETVVAARIPKDDADFLDKVVDTDIQWNTRSHLIKGIIHYWVEEQRAKKLEQLEKSQ